MAGKKALGLTQGTQRLAPRSRGDLLRTVTAPRMHLVSPLVRSKASPQMDYAGEVPIVVEQLRSLGIVGPM